MGDSVKDCQAIIYSKYGHHFAVGSTNNISIYNGYSCKKIKQINLSMGSSI